MAKAVVCAILLLCFMQHMGGAKAMTAKLTARYISVMVRLG